MTTILGNYLRNLRLENGEILKNMASRLEVSSAFLSAVENGKKKMPESWYSKLESLYNLDSSQLGKLRSAVLESCSTIEINMANISDENRELAVSFARKFNSLDEETTKKILKLLNKCKEE